MPALYNLQGIAEVQICRRNEKIRKDLPVLHCLRKDKEGNLKKMLIDLTQMRPGESGVIEQLSGGCGLVRRLQSMGIREGKKITKVSSHFWRGPQTAEIGNSQIAIGFGMAKRILVEVKR